jgi:hypothetical protein
VAGCSTTLYQKLAVVELVASLNEPLGSFSASVSAWLAGCVLLVLRGCRLVDCASKLEALACVLVAVDLAGFDWLGWLDVEALFLVL